MAFHTSLVLEGVGWGGVGWGASSLSAEPRIHGLCLEIFRLVVFGYVSMGFVFAMAVPRTDEKQ